MPNEINEPVSEHSEYVDDNDQAMTPMIDKTPHHSMGQSMAGSAWSQGHGAGAFTPSLGYQGGISPSSSAMHSPGGYDGGYSNNPMV